MKKRKLSRKDMELVECPTCKKLGFKEYRVSRIELKEGRKTKELTCCLCRTLGW